MDPKSIPRDIVTLLLALLLGAGVAAISRSVDLSASAGHSSATSFPSLPPSLSSAAGPRSMARPSPQAIACASAWEFLKDGRLTRDQRIQAQLALLDEWIRHDLAAALIAFSGELRGDDPASLAMYRFDPLPAMAASPDKVEDLLESGRLGLRTSLFRRLWLRHLAEDDPLGIFDRLGELPAEHEYSVIEAITRALPSISEDPAVWQVGMDRISAMVSGPVKVRKLQAIVEGLGIGIGHSDLNAAYLATADPNLKELFVRAAGESVRRDSDDPFADEPEIPDEIQSLSEPFRSAVIGKLKSTRAAGDVLPPVPEE